MRKFAIPIAATIATTIILPVALGAIHLPAWLVLCWAYFTTVAILIWGNHTAHPQSQRKRMWLILTMALGVTIFSVSALFYYIIQIDNLNREKIKLNPRAKLVVECVFTRMPNKMPASGTLWILQPFPTPIENGGGGLARSETSYGAELNWSEKHARSYRCTIRNYAPATLLNVSILLNLTFREAIKHDDGAYHSGMTTLSRPWPIVLDRIESGADNGFVFYIFPIVDQFATVRFPHVATGQRIDRGEPEELELVLPNDYGVTVGPAVDP